MISISKCLALVAASLMFTSVGFSSVQAAQSKAVDKIETAVKKKLSPDTVKLPDIDADGDGSHSLARGGDDCDDADPDRFPGNVEVADYDNHDEDCDYTTFGKRDTDGDGYFDAAACNIDDQGVKHCGTDCDDMRASVHPGQVDILNGRDENCDGVRDEDQTAAQLRQLLGLN